MKKILVLILSLTMLIIAGCGDDSKSEAPEKAISKICAVAGLGDSPEAYVQDHGPAKSEMKGGTPIAFKDKSLVVF